MAADNSCVSKTRNLEATKEAIFQAAQEAFASAPFENVRLREVAKKAGIDVALVNRYFGSKKDLFKMVMDRTHEESHLFAGVDRSNLVDALIPNLEVEKEPQHLQLLLIGACSISSPEVRLVIQESSMKYFISPLVEIIGGEDAQRKALLISSLLIGFTLANKFIFSEQITAMPQRSDQTLRSMIQCVLDES